MTRISAGECSCMDMEWYGVDRRGQIAVFCSAGVGKLPEFVCENVERADELIEYFDTLEKKGESRLYFHSIPRAEQVAQEFSDKGLYYFDSNDGSRYGISSLHEYYTKLSEPTEPLYFDCLPDDIKALLGENIIDVEDFSLADTIRVIHAY